MENYEQKYNNALKAARALYETKSPGCLHLESIFPELRESEDEKIRKELLEHCKNQAKPYIQTGNKCPQIQSWITWLEKQDSHYTFEIKKGHWYKCVCDYMLNGSDLIFKNNRLYYCRSDWRLEGEIDERNVKDIGVNGYKSFFRPATNQEIKDWLEKQDKKMSDPRYSILDKLIEADDIYQMSVNDAMVEEARNKAIEVLSKLEISKLLELEKQGEQKPVSKFKIGDTMRTLQEAKDGRTDGMPFVISIDSEYYNCNSEKIAIKDQDKYEYPPMNRKHVVCKSCDEKKPADKVEPKFHEGDWVVSEVTGSVYQIKNRVENLSNHKYGYDLVNGGYIGSNGVNYYHLWTIQDAKDGDILCCENGWTCIFKTLVNDENFSSYCFMDKTKWFCETGSECHTLNKEFMKAYNGEIKPATKEQRNVLMKTMADVGYTFDFEKKELKKIEQKSWSEEDEYYFGIIQYILNNECVGKADRENATTWFKFLKDRVQPKQEWSEEDETNASYICASLDCYYRLREDRNNTNGQENLDKARNWLYNRLKSLKARVLPQPKWSETDESRMNNLCHFLEEYGNQYYGYLTLQGTISWLKSLKPQTWKPSDEQMEVLAWCKPLFVDPKSKAVLESLINDLKKQKGE